MPPSLRTGSSQKRAEGSPVEPWSPVPTCALCQWVCKLHWPGTRKLSPKAPRAAWTLLLCSLPPLAASHPTALVWASPRCWSSFLAGPNSSQPYREHFKTQISSCPSSKNPQGRPHHQGAG